MNDSIKLKERETEETKKLTRLREYPALKIGRLGVDKKFKRKGLGKITINFIIGLSRHINQVSACRFLTVDSYPNAVPFYEKHRFIKNLMYEKRRDFVSMRRDIIDLIDYCLNENNFYALSLNISSFLMFLTWVVSQ